MIRNSPFLMLLAASGLLHLAGAGSALVWMGQPDEAKAEKASIRVALGSRGASAGQDVPPDTVTEEVAPPKPQPAPKPERARPIEPVDAPEADVPPEAEPDPAPAEPVQAVAALMGNAGQTGTGAETETDTEGDQADAGYEELLASYDGLVLGHLARFKTFPPAARMRGEEGHVGVAFEIDRSGALLDCRVMTPSGSRRLDKAALEQVRSAVPFPEAPHQADWQARTYTTTMRYTLK